MEMGSEASLISQLDNLDIQRQRTDGQKLTGTVKRYTPHTGYGFIKTDDGGEDCFVHQSEIQCEGFRCLKEGTQVEFFFRWRNGKPTATKVSGLGGIELPEFRSKFEATNSCSGISSENQESKIGRCKWFNNDKGFGFIICDDMKDIDIFVHINEIVNRRYLMPAEKVQFDIKEDGNGKYTAINVRPSLDMSAPINPYSFSSSPYPMPPPVYSPYGLGVPPSMGPSMAGMAGMGGMGGIGPGAGPGLNPSMSMSRPGIKFGRVKFYNQEKGFGFIYPMDGSNELYYKITPGMEMLKEGDIVEYRIQNAEDKEWAVEVRLADGKRGPSNGFAPPLPPYSMTFSPSGYAAPSSTSGSVRTGRVKFFNIEKGFGFIYPTDGSKEIYFGTQGISPGTLPDSFNEGELVEFNLQSSSHDDKFWAMDVRLISDARKRNPSTAGMSPKRNLYQDSRATYQQQPQPPSSYYEDQFTYQ